VQPIVPSDLTSQEIITQNINNLNYKLDSDLTSEERTKLKKYNTMMETIRHCKEKFSTKRIILKNLSKMLNG